MNIWYPVSCDSQHHSFLFCLQVGFDHFYNPKASGDKCTLFSDKLLVTRRNLSTEVKKKYSACKHFFFMGIEARIVVAAMSILGLRTLRGTPSTTKLPPNLETTCDKKCFLENLSNQVVDTFIMNEQALKSIALQQKYNDWLNECNPKTSDGRYKCRFSTCDKTFR